MPVKRNGNLTVWPGHALRTVTIRGVSNSRPRCVFQEMDKEQWPNRWFPGSVRPVVNTD